MARKRYTAEEMIGHLRTLEIEMGKGLAVVDACRKREITEQTSSRGKQEYGGLRVDQAKRLKGLEQENARLNRLYGDHGGVCKWLSEPQTRSDRQMQLGLFSVLI